MLSFVFEEGWQMQSIGLQSHFPGMLCEAAPLGYLHANRAECHKAANPATEKSRRCFFISSKTIPALPVRRNAAILKVCISLSLLPYPAAVSADAALPEDAAVAIAAGHCS